MIHMKFAIIGFRSNVYPIFFRTATINFEACNSFFIIHEVENSSLEFRNNDD